MKTASTALARRLRAGYVGFLALFGCALLVVGLRFSGFLDEARTRQRMIDLAQHQGAFAQRVTQRRILLDLDPSLTNRQVIRDWLIARGISLEQLSRTVRALCGSADDPLCTDYESLQSAYVQWVGSLDEPGVNADRLLARARAYQQAADRWASDFTARSDAALSADKRELLYYSCGISILVALLIVLIAEPKIRTLRRERLSADIWTAERAQLAAVAEWTHHAVYVTNRKGQLEWANDAFVRLTGHTLESASGAPIVELLRGPKTSPADQATIERHFAAGTGFQIEIVHHRADGTAYWALLDCRPIRSASGSITGYAAVESDITVRKRSEQLISQQRALLTATAAVAGVGGWEINLDSGELTWSDLVFDIFELPRGVAPPLHQHFELIAPEHRELLREAFHRALHEGCAYDIVVRVITARGNPRWVRCVCDPALSENRAIRLTGAIQDVTAMHEAAEALEAAKIAAEAANVAKGDFLANVSHEIRTPLSGALGMIDLLLEGPLSTQQREYAAIARSSGQSLLVLINQLLDLSKVDSGRLDLEHIEFDVRKVVEDAVDAMVVEAGRKSLEIWVRCDLDDTLRLRGDPMRLGQVLLNLLSNAVKFTAVGDITVAVTATPSEHRAGACDLRMAVVDTGAGVAPDQMSRIFAPFVQGDPSTTRRHGGTGLGLPIAQRLIEAMGGRIRVESLLGAGSTFTAEVTLDAGTADTEAVPRPSLRGYRFLVVEANRRGAASLEGMVAGWGAASIMAATAAEALVCFARLAAAGTSPEFAIIDGDLPDHSASWLIRGARANFATAACRFILLRAIGSQGASQDLASFDRVVNKPVKPRVLRMVIDELLESVVPRSPPRALPTYEVVPSAPASRLSSATLSDISGARVLLVEDNFVNRKLAEHHLETLGALVTHAHDGAEAVKLLGQQPFDVVLMDCQMPVMDGYEATRLIRSGAADCLDPNIPIIALTAHAMDGARERCIAAGMDRYLSKPFDLKQLTAVLREVLIPA